MQRGDLLRLEITGVAHGGTFIARHDGRVVFVSDAIPGEKVVVRVTEVKSSLARAETLEVVTPSPDRRARHVWHEADITRDPRTRPGGADYGHITLDGQRALKARVLREALERFAAPETAERFRSVAVAPVADERDDAIGWRTRVSLHVGGSGDIGPVAARSHSVVAVDSYPLLHPDLAEWARELRTGPAGGRVDGVRTSGGEIVRIDRARPARRSGRTPAPVEARTRITETVGSRAFGLDAGGFWQVHRGAARTLHEVVATATAHLNADDNAEHLDLYGGVGLLAAAIADGAGGDHTITTVESAPRARAHAEANLSDLPNATAIAASVEHFLTGMSHDRRTGVVVLDPPRSGAGRDVVTHLVERKPDAIIYVACDPVALARDLGTFAELGYEAQRLEAFDFFPHTHHLEAVVTITPQA